MFLETLFLNPLKYKMVWQHQVCNKENIESSNHVKGIAIFFCFKVFAVNAKNTSKDNMPRYNIEAESIYLQN